MEDQKIVQMIWDRMEQGLAELTEKYGSYCFSIAQHILSNREDAGECVNDTWLRVWNAIPPHRPACLPGFLGKIVRNLSLNAYKKSHAAKRGGGNVPLALEELEECISDGRRVEEHLEQEMLVAVITGFLKEQASLQRVIFLRRYFYMDSVKEIAAALNMKEGTVKSVLSRMRKELRLRLEKEAVYL